MRLYHGSNCRITKVDLSFSRNFMDFGPGFYLTPDFQRAVTMANRCVTLRNEGEPEINPFIFNKATCPPEVRIREFKRCDREWAEFVMLNRDRHTVPAFRHDYDIVIGPVADSRVDAVIADYRKATGDNYLERDNLQRRSRLLMYPGPTYIQYCFCTPLGLQSLIPD